MAKYASMTKILSEEQKALAGDSYRLALKFSRLHRAPLGMTRDDWEGECFYALCVAAYGYKESVGKFSTYAFKCLLNHRHQLWNSFTRLKRGFLRTRRLGLKEEQIQAQQVENFSFVKEEALACVRSIRGREREIIQRRMKGETFREMASDYGISIARCHDIYLTAINRIKTRRERMPLGRAS